MIYKRKLITAEEYIKHTADKYIPLLAIMGKTPNILANSQKFQNKQMMITVFSWYLKFQMGICGPELAAGSTIKYNTESQVLTLYKQSSHMQ